MSLFSIVSERIMLANKKQLNCKNQFLFHSFFFLLLDGRFSFNEINLKIEWLFFPSLCHLFTHWCAWLKFYTFSKCRHGPNTHIHTQAYTRTDCFKWFSMNSHNNNKLQSVVVVFIRAIARDAKYCWLILFFGFGFCFLFLFFFSLWKKCISTALPGIAPD